MNESCSPGAAAIFCGGLVNDSYSPIAATPLRSGVVEPCIFNTGMLIIMLISSSKCMG